MNGMVYVFAAFATIWAGVLLYVVRLVFLKRALEVRLEKLEKKFFQVDKGIE